MKKLKLFAVLLLIGAMGISSVSAEPTSDLLAQLQMLQAQVSNLQNQLRGVQGGQSVFTTSTNPLLTVIKTGNGFGLVTSNPTGINCGSDCTENYVASTTVWLYALADQGSVFGAWTGCDFVSSTACRVQMNYDRTVNVRFDPASSTYNLSVTLSGNGTGYVSSYPSGIYCGHGYNTCSANFPAGSDAYLYAYKDSGSNFGAWTGCDQTGGGNPVWCRVLMNRDRTTDARFDRIDNSPPSLDYLSGPTQVVVNTSGTWTARASDVNGNLMLWDMTWGDNSSSSRAASGSSSMIMVDHAYNTTGLKSIIFKIWDTDWAYAVASTTVSVIANPIKKILPLIQQGSLIQSAQTQLGAMVLQLQEMLKLLR